MKVTSLLQRLKAGEPVQKPESVRPPSTSHVIPSSSGDDSDGGALVTDVKFLGRARPLVFSGPLAEAGFIFTVVLSMMTSEYFVGGFDLILPSIAEALHMPPAARTWPAGVVTLTTASLLQPFARLCDMYGSRRVFLYGQAWLLAWSVVTGFSVNTTMLIVCRAMQGIGAAAFLPAGLALLGHTYRPGPRKNVAFSIYGAFACVGFYFGIFLGALAAEFMTWRWYFWFGAVACLITLASGLLTIPRDLSDVNPDAAMDWLGVCTIVPGLVLVVFAFTDAGDAFGGWRNPYIFVTLIVGVLFLAAAVYVQGWVSAQPLLPPALFKPKYMKRLMLSLFCYYGVFGIFLLYTSFYIENTLGVKPLMAAAWYTPLAVGGMFLAIGGGLVLHIIPNRILLLISGFGFFLSVLLFALIPGPDDGKSLSFIYWAYVFSAMLGGTLGIDVTFNVTNVFITTAMPRRLQAAASGVINSLLYLGVAFWLGVAQTAISTADERQEGGIKPEAQYRIAFWTGVGLAAVGLLLTASIKMGQASAGLTADERLAIEDEERSVSG
ncbi:drug resistance protein [Ophiocordyceps camponoti-floridani]|uniref:Drug resistance protein n=1 Tax=Ophiocordyceps camponoti-floridani TaxID=2030778 RepID=A0A8H4VCF9_9HYPO|nr:drug resistance protein [Ophiocordyceps camponoti-floridani]